MASAVRRQIIAPINKSRRRPQIVGGGAARTALGFSVGVVVGACVGVCVRVDVFVYSVSSSFRAVDGCVCVGFGVGSGSDIAAGSGVFNDVVNGLVVVFLVGLLVALVFEVEVSNRNLVVVVVKQGK